jgi:hypothetical protein
MCADCHSLSMHAHMAFSHQECTPRRVSRVCMHKQHAYIFMFTYMPYPLISNIFSHLPVLVNMSSFSHSLYSFLIYVSVEPKHSALMHTSWVSREKDADYDFQLTNQCIRGYCRYMDRASELDRTFNAEKERFNDDREDAVQKINELLDKRAELGAVVAKSKAKAKYYRGQVSCRIHDEH